MKQRRIADVILSSPTAASYSTTEELAKAAGVTKATVVRFCQNLGFSGYTQLRTHLRDTLHLEESYWPLELMRKTMPESDDTIVQASLRQDLRSLQNLFTPQFEESLARAVETIAAARRILVISTGSHAATGLLLAHNLTFIGRPTLLENRGGSYLGQALSTMTPADLVISVVFWYVQPEVPLALQWCREHGVPTFAITDNPLSSPAKQADDCLVVPAEGVAFFRSQVAAMAAANALLTRVAAVDHDRTVAAITRSQSTWNKLQIFDQNRIPRTRQDWLPGQGQGPSQKVRRDDIF